MDFGTHGAFSWLELAVDDVDGAKAFYTELFGWRFDTKHVWEEGPGYEVIQPAGAPEGMGIGGIMPKPPNMPVEAPPPWTAYVTVKDVDATAAKARELGATVLVEPMDIPTVGRMVWIQDPQGAVIAAVTYEGM